MRERLHGFGFAASKAGYVIVAFTAFLLALLWGAVAYELYHDRTAVLDAARVNIANLARAYAEHVIGTLRPLDQMLLRIKMGYEQNPLGPDLAQQLRFDAAIEAGAVLAGITDAQGNILSASAPLSPAARFIGDREYFLAHAKNDSGQLNISEPLVGRYSGKQVTVLSRRLNNPAGAFAGIVFVSFDPEYLSGFFSDLVIAKYSSFAIVGRDMIVRDMILGTGPAEVWIGKSVANSQLVPELARAATGDYETVSVLDRVVRLFSYRSLPDFPLVVLVGVGDADVLGGYYERKAWLIGVAATLSLIFVGGALFQMRRSTLQSHAEQALRQTQEFLIESQRVAKLGYVLNDVPSKRVYWSDSLFELRGVPKRDSFTLEESANFMEPEDRARYFVAREAAFAEQRRLVIDVRIRRPNGSIGWEHRVAHPHFNARGELTRVLMVIQDVTERQAVESQLLQAQKMEAIGNLTGGMAHDFNNLLGVVIGNLDLLRPLLKADPDADALAGEALDASLRGADLTRRLLAFARRQPLQPQLVDINRLVSDTAKLLERVLGGDIHLSLTLAAEIWHVHIDPAQFQSSLVNLANNARDAMPNGGTLSIKTENRVLDADYCAARPEITPGDYVSIEITDTGTGMSAEIAGRIFEPFFTTKAPGKGTGLGLSMVFGFMKQSGGHINVYSEVGIGTTFRLFLPRDRRAGSGVTAKEEAPASPARGETVLVVEDDESLRRVVLRQITGLGYRALEAQDAATALDLLEREKIDVLFTDIVMPGGIDGFRLARLAIEKRPDIKIILSSGFPGARIRENRGPLDPSTRLLSKPYRKEDLSRMLREVLDTPS